MSVPRHDFYETDEKLIISIFAKGADPGQVSIKITPRSVIYENGDQKLVLNPLKGDINAEASDFSVGKVKIEVRLTKALHSQGRWGKLIQEASDLDAPILSNANSVSTATSPTSAKRHKNWDALTNDILSKEKDKTTTEDPNAGGDGAVNSFFQKIYGDADENTRRAMMKSYSESGGTTLSTNWDEVGKGEVTVKPPEGSEWKRWG